MTNNKIDQDNKLSQLIELPDGRRLGYATYGDPEGYPVLAFHGTPGSRLWFEEEDPISKKLGVRLITTDRPGYGISDVHPKRELLNYPEDIAVLLEKLKIDQCSVIGISGGSIFAAACAFSLSDKVRKTGLIAGVPEFYRGRPPKGMCRENKFSFIFARRFPIFLKLFMAYGRKMMFSSPEDYLNQIQNQVSHLCEADRKIMQDPQNASHLLCHLKEANKQGVKGIIQEMQLVTRPWKFNPGKIRTEVEIWHGTEDTLAPFDRMNDLADKIPRANMNRIEGQGHFLDATPENWERILQSILPGQPEGKVSFHFPDN